MESYAQLSKAMRPDYTKDSPLYQSTTTSGVDVKSTSTYPASSLPLPLPLYPTPLYTTKSTTASTCRGYNTILNVLEDTTSSTHSQYMNCFADIPINGGRVIKLASLDGSTALYKDTVVASCLHPQNNKHTLMKVLHACTYRHALYNCTAYSICPIFIGYLIIRYHWKILVIYLISVRVHYQFVTSHCIPINLVIMFV